MRKIDYKLEYEKVLSPEVVAYIGQIREMKASYTHVLGAHSSELDQLLEVAKIQSTEASNRIEGIVTTEDRLKKLMHEATVPQNRGEREIAGYRDVLAMIHESYEYIPVTSNMILQLHEHLYRFSASSIGGKYKDSDNLIAEQLPDGSAQIRFTPVPAWETAEAMRTICNAYREALKESELDPLILIPLFILDFLCVHPFNDGNGRMSRLLTLLLLYRADYSVGQYISIEKLIADTKESYYEALYASSVGWHEEENDYEPFVRYMLGVILAAYREFDSRHCLVSGSGQGSKTDAVRRVAREYRRQFTKGDLIADCPSISQKTIERALRGMLDRGDIVKVSSGRYAAYVWNSEKE